MRYRKYMKFSETHRQRERQRHIIKHKALKHNAYTNKTRAKSDLSKEQQQPK